MSLRSASGRRMRRLSKHVIAMYDPIYLRTVARIASQEKPLDHDAFLAFASNWMPIKRDEKTGLVLFPLQEDYDFAWEHYRQIMGDAVGSG